MKGIDNTNFIDEDDNPRNILPSLGAASSSSSRYSDCDGDGRDLNCSPVVERDAEKSKTHSQDEMSNLPSNPTEENLEGCSSTSSNITVSVPVPGVQVPKSKPEEHERQLEISHQVKVRKGESENAVSQKPAIYIPATGENDTNVTNVAFTSYRTIPIPTLNLMTRKTFDSPAIPALPLPQHHHHHHPHSRCEINSELEFHYNFLFTFEQFRRRMWRICRGYCIVWPCLIFLTWALIYTLFGTKESFPGGSLFSLFVLEIFAIVLGELMSLISLPPLIGMLGAGLFLRNVDILGYNIALDLPLSLSSPLRAISVVVLLTRGGFSVNPTLIRKFIRVVPQLAVFCCIVEAVVAGTAVYFFIGFPIQWAALQGCIMSAMSGAAVMPFLLSFENTCKLDVGSPASKAIAIAKTGCGLDAILAICMAEFCLGFIFGDGKLGDGLMKGVVEVMMGGAFGLTWGFLAGFFLGEQNSAELRTFAVFGGGILGLLGMTRIGYPRGGPLAVFSGSLVTSIMWRRNNVDGTNNDKVNKHFTQLWFIFQPLLFGIIGSRTDLFTVDWNILANAILCLTFSLSARILTAVAMSSCVSLTLREMFFLAVAWIPKGTVQAALGPVALDTVKDTNFGPEAEKLGYQVMSIAVLTIILGSTIGSFFLLIFGPRLLRPPDNNDNHSDSITKKVND